MLGNNSDADRTDLGVASFPCLLRGLAHLQGQENGELGAVLFTGPEIFLCKLRD